MDKAIRAQGFEFRERRDVATLLPAEAEAN
jgi:hypothetical protein